MSKSYMSALQKDKQFSHGNNGNVKGTYVPKGSSSSVWAVKGSAPISQPRQAPNNSNYEIDYMSRYGFPSYNDFQEQNQEEADFLSQRLGVFDFEDKPATTPIAPGSTRNPIKPPQQGASRFMTHVFGKEPSAPSAPNTLGNDMTSSYLSTSPFETSFHFDITKAQLTTPTPSQEPPVEKAPTLNNEPEKEVQQHSSPQNVPEKTMPPQETQQSKPQIKENGYVMKKMNSKTKLQKLSLQEFYSKVGGEEDASDEEEACRVLWVGNIGPEVTEKDLEQEFSQFGKLESLRILHDRFCAFVNFEEEKSAREAKKHLQGTIIGSQYILINYRKTEGKPVVTTPPGASTVVPPHNENNFILNNPSRALWIGNISNLISEEDLIKTFSRYGEIESVRLLRYKTCAFVNFYEVEHAQKALQELQGKQLGDMPIKINFGKPQPPASRPKENVESSPVPKNPPLQPQKTTNYFSQDYGNYTTPNTFQQPLSTPYLPSLNSFQPSYSTLQLCDACRYNSKQNTFSPCGHGCCNQCLSQLRSLTVMSPEKGIKCPRCNQPVINHIPVQMSAFPF